LGRSLTPDEEKSMASTAMDEGAAKAGAEAEVKRLQSELDTLKKEFETRIGALEAKLPAALAEDHVSAETLAIIAVAVTAFLGKKVKIHSAHLLPTVNQWTQAGRVVIQASHDLKR
jgi:hypothetical protein